MPASSKSSEYVTPVLVFIGVIVILIGIVYYLVSKRKKDTETNFLVFGCKTGVVISVLIVAIILAVVNTKLMFPNPGALGRVPSKSKFLWLQRYMAKIIGSLLVYAFVVCIGIFLMIDC